jgi:hypothetical protein
MKALAVAPAFDRDEAVWGPIGAISLIRHAAWTVVSEPSSSRANRKVSALPAFKAFAMSIRHGKQPS